MLSKNELDKITIWLNYLACGIVDNGLKEEDNREILDLSTRCFSEICKMEK